MTVLGPNVVDPMKLTKREYKDQRKVAHELYEAFVHEALRDLVHKDGSANGGSSNV